PPRWVINFFDWPLDRESAPDGYTGPVAADYPDCFRIVEEKVKPERTRKNERDEFVLRKPLPQRWWIYGDKRPAMTAATEPLSQVLVKSEVGNQVSFAFVPKGYVLSHMLVVLAVE